MDLRLLSRQLLLLAACVCASVWPAVAEEPLRAAEVPAPLAPWLPWVLHGEVDPACPFVVASGQRQCAWPGRLSLAIDASGARFAADVEAWSTAALPLPGSEGHWPQTVTVDGAPSTVIAQDGVPTVKLPAGRHRIEGSYTWTRAPETLAVPPAYGLLALTLHGAAVGVPQRAPSGELWLQAPATTTEAEADALRLQVYRRVIDEQPLQVDTVLDFDVAGTQREVSFDGAVLADSVPMRVDSDLPARLDDDGRLHVQVRPGHWRVRLTTRQPGPVDALARPAGGAHWPAEELWVFEARPALRLVEPQGGTPVDPKQTNLPADWHAFPAWRLQAGDTLGFTLQRRGDPLPAPDQLNLQRQIWLDFDGDGYTVQDTISGVMTRGWRLDASAALAPGRVLLNGEPQFITELDGRHGVELRRGAVDLRADSRIESPAALNAVGWAQDFNSVSATLHLPPGWRLWSARGVDQLPDTWLRRWTLLDLFLVFIVALASARLWSWPLGVVMLLTLVLCWHEPGAPRQVWLHVLASMALARALPTGRLHTLASIYRNGALLALVVICVGFAITQLRLGLYPQLELPYQVGGQAVDQPLGQDIAVADSADAAMEVESAPAAAPLPEAMVRKALRAAPGASSGPWDEPRSGSDAGAYSVQREYDPQANIQTGPGLPGWQWRQAQLGWSGPVAADQPLELSLLSPRVNLALACLRVALLLGLLALVLRTVFSSAERLRTALVVLLALGGASSAQAAGDSPDPALLDELKRRVLLAPDCVPSCAAVPRLQVTLIGQRLQLRLEVHARAALGVPLPGQADHWLPDTVLVDGAATAGLARDGQGGLLLALPPGVHDVLLDGVVPRRASFQLALPLAAQHASVDAEGWAIDGLDPAGGHATQLIFTRRQQASDVAPARDEARALPPFFALERTLQLGLEWRVHNRLVRVTPPGVGAALSIPLLAGEAVTTAELKVAGNRVLLDIGAEDTVREWTSVLAKTDTIALEAPDTTAWSETWRADISPIWHATLDGIPVVHHQDAGGAWLPTWRPWPGETVHLTLSRPAGVAGRTLTVDRSELRLMPGQRATDGVLAFTARSSQGGQHKLTLPAGAELQSVAINGVSQPIRQEDRLVSLPIVPGEQQIELGWRSAETVSTRWSTPAFDLGTDSVNATVYAVLPADRWVLAAGGPALGPAVLFWGTLIVVVMVAVVLGRLRLAPIPTWHWLLLGVGLTQTTVASAAVIVGWLLALGLRGRVPSTLPKWQFNGLQLVLAGLTVIALSLLFDAIRHGLLGIPAMQIAGNGSNATELRWFQDRAPGAYPQAWVWSVSIWFYRGLMLAWALWLAFALLGWLRWGWQSYSRDGVWRRVSLFGGKSRSAVTAPPPVA
jgi:hypothetical protein